MTTKPTKEFIFGVHPIEEAIDSGVSIDQLLLSRNTPKDSDLLKLARDHNISIRYVPNEKLDRITRKNHQGAIAFTSPISFSLIEDIIPTIYEAGLTPLLMVLDGVTDTRNFGAIVRSAECAGVQAIIIPHKGSARIGGDAVKTSAGALFKVPICKTPNLKQTLTFLQNSGIQLVACSEKASDFHFQADLSIPSAFIMGSESDGIDEEHIRKADRLVKIPMPGKVTSLNVSVAGGIVLFEAVRQRMDNA